MFVENMCIDFSIVFHFLPTENMELQLKKKLKNLWSCYDIERKVYHPTNMIYSTENKSDTVLCLKLYFGLKLNLYMQCNIL